MSIKYTIQYNTIQYHKINDCLSLLTRLVEVTGRVQWSAYKMIVRHPIAFDLYREEENST